MSKTLAIFNGMNTFDQIYKVVSTIPRGKVTTYGEISNYLKLANPRIVGYALHVNGDPDNVPCHRVVNKKGELAPGYAFGGPNIQKKLLEIEGIEIQNNKIDLSKYLYKLS